MIPTLFLRWLGVAHCPTGRCSACRGHEVTPLRLAVVAGSAAALVLALAVIGGRSA